MAYYCVFGGAGFFTAPTLGNLITASKVRVTAKKMAMPSAGGFLFSQSGAGSSREFGILINSGELRYVYGSSAERVIFTSGEMASTFGAAPYKCDLLDIIFNSADNTVKVFVNGSASPAKTVSLVKGASRINGMLFRVGARCDSDSDTSVGGGFITPNLTWVGDLKIYIDDALVRDYVIPSTGTTIPDLVGGNTLTQRGTWPAGDGEWIFYDAGGTTDATISYDIGAIDFAVIAESSAPAASASIGYDIGEISFAISADSSAPVASASVDYDIGAIEFSVSASAFAPGSIATVSYDIGAIEFSVSASSSVPVFQSEIAYDIGAIEFNIQAAATAAGNFATIAYDIGAIDFNVSADSSVPVVSATAIYDIGEVSFSISAAASAPGSAATVSFDIGEIVFAVSASATGPVPQDISATIGYDIGAISFSVVTTVTGIGLGSGIGYGVQFIEPSRGFTFTEPSRGVQF